MPVRFRVLTLSVVVLLLAPFSRTGAAQGAAAPEHWVATWASAQQSRGGGARGTAPGGRGGGPIVQPAAGQTGAPAPTVAPGPVQPPTSPSPAAGLSNETIRMAVRASIGGTRLRIHVSNAFGTTPLTVGAAHVALRSKDSEIVPGTDRVVSFDGKGAVVVPPGAVIVSDAVDLDVPTLGELAVSLYVPSATGPLSGHSMALQTTYLTADGDATGQPAITGGTTSQAWYWVSEIDVEAPAGAATIVTLGDSITDGATSTPGTYRSWPSRLAERLAANPTTAQVAIVNEGISGNKVLADGAGVSALARFDRDVLGLPGVRWLMILEGINDIGGIQRGLPLDADALLAGLKQLAIRAHAHGIKVIGCTLTPYGGAGYYSEEGEAIRQRVNALIRTSPLFDAVVDFDAVTRDPANPGQLLPAYNNTDHLHPNDAGYEAMANAVDLSLFATR